LESVLVTGAAGFIGSHVVEHLLAEGHRVVGLDNFDPFYSPAEKRRNLSAAVRHDGFRLIEASCQDLATVTAGLEDERFDVIVHLAAKAGVRPSIEDPQGYAVSNVMGTQAMLELARRKSVHRFVFGSSSSVYGNTATVPFVETDPAAEPVSPYAATKRAGELLCHTYAHLFGMSILALRFFTVYGPRQRPDLAIRKFTDLISRRQPVLMFGDGTTERDYTWIDDIVDGVVAAIRHTRTRSGYDVVNLGGSRTTSLARLIDLIGKALDRPPEVQRLPDQPGDVRRTWADVRKAGELLGYRPKVPVEDGIPRFVEWFKSYSRSGG
jgi:UDP-glucuronate 4-epimerase